MLADVHRQIANLLHAMPATAAPEVTKLGLIGALRQAVDGELASAFDGVSWRVEPGAEDAAGAIPGLSAEVAFYAAREAIRNAARYGRNGELSRPLHLAVSVARRHQDGVRGSGLEIAIEDDGVGIGATGASAEGSGQGLGLHGTMMAVIGGALTAESVPGAYTRITLALPDS
jgi:signal transduction histidine kinase